MNASHKAEVGTRGRWCSGGERRRTCRLSARSLQGLRIFWPCLPHPAACARSLPSSCVIFPRAYFDTEGCVSSERCGEVSVSLMAWPAAVVGFLVALTRVCSDAHPLRRMFADFLHLTQLETFGFPTTTITTSDTASGNMGAIWNYGASDSNDFAALGNSDDGSAAMIKTQHAGGVGAFGVYGVTDSNYDSDSTQKITPCTIPTLKPRAPFLLALLRLHCIIALLICAFSQICVGKPLRNCNHSTPNPTQARASPARNPAAAKQLESAPAFQQTVFVS